MDIVRTADHSPDPVSPDPTGPRSVARSAEGAGSDPAAVPDAARKVALTPYPTLMTGVGQVPFWRRFHVRMSSLFGGVVFLVVTLMAIAFYLLEVENQVKALRGQ